MGKSKKEKNRLAKEGKEYKDRTKGENHYHNASKVKLLNMYKGGKPIRDKDGKIIKAADYQSKDIPNARVDPHRKWFSSTRVIEQNALTEFRERIENVTSDPFQVLLKRNKLPMSLIHKPSDQPAKVNVVETEPFAQTFGPNSQRKRPRLQFENIDEMAGAALELSIKRQEEEEDAREDAEEWDYAKLAREHIYTKGQSRRIWNELYKVIDSSDVIVHVLDARDPVGTRCKSVETYLRKEAPHKHLIFVLNKCDLVPNWVTVSFIYFIFYFFMFAICFSQGT